MQDADALMTAIRAHDAQAFERLFDEYHRTVYGLSLRMLRDRAAAEDVTQAIFLKVWHAPELYRGGNLGAWLVRMTRNRCIDQLRARVHLDLESAPETATEIPLEDAALGEIECERVRSAVATLPAELRRPIELGFFGGLSHSEIANKTGTPLGTVKTRIRAGLLRLRSQLGSTVNR